MTKRRCVKFEETGKTRCYSSVDRASAPFVTLFFGAAIVAMIVIDQLFF